MKNRLRMALLATLTLSSIAFAGCASDADVVDEESAGATEDAITSTAPCTHCVIVPQVSLRGVKLGMTTAQVMGVLGKPGSVTPGVHEITNEKLEVLTYGLTAITVHEKGGVKSMNTTSPRVKTADGVGVGSNTAAVKASLSGEKCDDFNCAIGGEGMGDAATIFDFDKHGIVTKVWLYEVITD